MMLKYSYKNDVLMYKNDVLMTQKHLLFSSCSKEVISVVNCISAMLILSEANYTSKNGTILIIEKYFNRASVEQFYGDFVVIGGDFNLVQDISLDNNNYKHIGNQSQKNVTHLKRKNKFERPIEKSTWESKTIYIVWSIK